MRTTRQQFSRRGNVALMVGLSLFFILAISAVVIDLGYGRLVHEELENAADAAALAAAARLDGTDDGVDDARATAVWIASENRAGGQPVAMDENVSNATTGDIVLGVYDEDDGDFTVSSNAAQINAVQVRARIPALGLFVAPVAFDTDTVVVSASSRTFINHGGAGAAECIMPLGMPSCLVSRYGTSGLQNVMLKLQPAGIDNVGYARPNASPNASWTRDQINNCQNSGEVAIGDMLGLQNGQTTTALSSFVTALENSTTRWDTAKWGTLPTRSLDSSVSTAKYGRTYEGIVPVFDGGTSYCTGSGGAYNGSAPIVGFVWGAIYEVINNGKASNRTIRMRLDFTRTYNAGTATGGPEWGVVADDPPRVVAGD